MDFYFIDIIIYFMFIYGLFEINKDKYVVKML